ncbi:MAG TPA: hypothetical protein VML55_12165 [Planctomycetaceae bacterium]|nr:hypothetical protein [Planctomycetaceae bacterium]
MLLDLEDAALFFSLHHALMCHVNGRLHVLPDPVDTPEEFSHLPPEDRLQVRDAFSAHPELLDDFVRENPFDLPHEHLEIVAAWRHLVAGRMILLRQLKKHAIFLTTTDPPVAYGVLALVETFDEMLNRPWPVLADAVLLPFRDRIVYDSLMSSQNIFFGPGIRRGFEDDYRTAKERFGIVTSLPFDPLSAGSPSPDRQPAPARRPPKRSKAPRRPSNPFAGRWRIDAMRAWEADFLDVDEPGCLQFDERGGYGSFHFGYLDAEIDYRLTERDGQPAAEFTWEGADHVDIDHGRGWAIVNGDTLHGMLYPHCGEETTFECTRSPRQPSRRKRSRRTPGNTHRR